MECFLLSMTFNEARHYSSGVSSWQMSYIIWILALVHLMKILIYISLEPNCSNLPNWSRKKINVLSNWHRMSVIIPREYGNWIPYVWVYHVTQRSPCENLSSLASASLPTTLFVHACTIQKTTVWFTSLHVCSNFLTLHAVVSLYSSNKTAAEHSWDSIYTRKLHTALAGY